MSEYWYIRVKGQASGPFDQSQIESLVRRQRLGRLDEVSLDKVTWRRAAEFPELFPATVTKKVRKPPPPNPAEVNLPLDTYASRTEPQEFMELDKPASTPLEEWFFAANGNRSGPVSFSDLRIMLSDGRLLLTDPIWTEGMDNWVPAGQLPELVVQSRAPLPRSGSLDQGGRILAGYAVASLVLGILGLTLLFGFGGILAIVFGHLALAQIKQEPERYSGKGQAMAGMIMGYVALGLMLVLLIVLLITSQAARGV